MRLLVAGLALGLSSLPVVSADPQPLKGTFVGPGIYATAEGCLKFAVLQAGGDRNVGSVPETLTMDGFEGWEGGCSFTAITEQKKKRVWRVKMWCGEGPNEGPESDVFERLADGKIKVTIMGNATTFERCDAGTGQ